MRGQAFRKGCPLHGQQSLTGRPEELCVGTGQHRTLGSIGLIACWSLPRSSMLKRMGNDQDVAVACAEWLLGSIAQPSARFYCQRGSRHDGKRGRRRCRYPSCCPPVSVCRRTSCENSRGHGGLPSASALHITATTDVETLTRFARCSVTGTRSTRKTSRTAEVALTVCCDIEYSYVHSTPLRNRSERSK